MLYFWGKLAEVLSALLLFYPSLKAIAGQAMLGRMLKKSYSRSPQGDIDWLFRMLHHRKLLRITKLDIAMFSLGFLFFVCGSYLSAVSAMQEKGHRWSDVLPKLLDDLVYMEKSFLDGIRIFVGG